MILKAYEKINVKKLYGE